jgi:hypothetical protein
MKSIIVALLLNTILSIMVCGQNKSFDTFRFDKLSINGLLLGDSISKMKILFGKPKGSFEVKSQPDCKEWCERNHTVMYYGDTHYDTTRHGYIAISECEFKELHQKEMEDIITAFKLNSKRNTFVLKYKDTEFLIGDDINQDKYQELFPKAFNKYNEAKRQGKHYAPLTIYLIDKNHKSVGVELGVETLNFYFTKKGTLQEISIDYPLE